MKKMLFFGLSIMLLPAMVFAQEKVEGPVWNAGDKWIFTGGGSVEVVKADQSGYTVKFSEGKCVFEKQGFDAILFEKATFNRIYSVKGDNRKKYIMGLSKILDFPLSIGKQGKTGYSSADPGLAHPISYDFSEIYKGLGWEDITIQAGKFKAFRVEYRRKAISSSGQWANVGEEIVNQYWYSPDVKYFVKCQYDKDWMKDKKGIFNWELTSFQLKK